MDKIIIGGGESIEPSPHSELGFMVVRKDGTSDWPILFRSSVLYDAPERISRATRRIVHRLVTGRSRGY